jgi:ferredoxin
MTVKKIPHTDLSVLLDRLRARGTVYAPSPDGNGGVELSDTPSDDPVALEFRNYRLSPKALFLPQSQTLLTFRDGKAEEPTPPDKEVFLFGIRPCDASALRALDEVFLDSDPPDPYYAALRANSTVIALACTRPTSSCFCTSVGGGPGDGDGADVLAVGLEADLLLKAQTPKGEELLAAVEDLTTDAADDAIEEAEKRISAAEDLIAPVKLEDSAQHLRDGYDSPMWETASQKCLGCGTCSYLCPTCHCFDITDEVKGDAGRRVRTWDCCAYPLFTLHASGHNPRPTPKERWRQRLMHKFRYAVENFDRLFCVGCGRCIRNCPVSMDVRTTLRDLGA